MIEGELWTPGEDAELRVLWAEAEAAIGTDSVLATCRYVAARLSARRPSAEAVRRRARRLGLTECSVARSKWRRGRNPSTRTRLRLRVCGGCQRNKNAFSRGLCAACYLRAKNAGTLPEIRTATGLTGEASTPDGKALDPLPCPFPPGSKGKVLWLMCRARDGYFLWHPEDAGPEAWEGLGANRQAGPVVQPGEGKAGADEVRVRRLALRLNGRGSVHATDESNGRKAE